MADRYDPVRAALPDTLPSCTGIEAMRARQRLWKHFAKREVNSRYRRCWISTKPTGSDADRGWARLIHDVSHRIFAHIYPSRRPHDPLHSHYETQIAKYVVEKGWLDGALRPKPKKRAAPKPKPTPSDKLAKVNASIKRWETKAKRAATALKKLRRRRAALARHATFAPHHQQQAEGVTRTSQALTV